MGGLEYTYSLSVRSEVRLIVSIQRVIRIHLLSMLERLLLKMCTLESLGLFSIARVLSAAVSI